MTDDQRRLIEAATVEELADAQNVCGYMVHESERAKLYAPTLAGYWHFHAKLESWRFAAACVAAVAEQRRGGADRG